MKKVFLLSEITLNMNNGKDVAVVQQKITADTAAHFMRDREVVSFIGNADSARVVSDILNCVIPANRGNFTWDQMGPDDEAFIIDVKESTIWWVFPVMGDGLFQMFEAAAREGANLRA